MSVFAHGGGGVFSGEQIIIDGYNNMPVRLETSGGYGYGAGRSGTRTGGFGMVLHADDYGHVAGAFGGFITGKQYSIGPFMFSGNLWTGVGYVNPAVLDVPGSVGFIGEATVEAGFAPISWFQIGIYAGMQAIGVLDGFESFNSARYAPIAGTRVTWGSF
jgi:hypothetical protein